MSEIWKRMIYNGEDFGDYYLVSNTGKIKGVKTGKIRNQNINKEGYYFVSISLGCREKKKTIKIHKAVAETFIPKIDGKNIVNHIDSNRLNNNVENLEWCTSKENFHHAVHCGRFTLDYNQTPIKCIETGIIFDTIVQAAKWCGCATGNIGFYLNQDKRNKRRNYAGKHPETQEKLHWCYV